MFDERCCNKEKCCNKCEKPCMMKPMEAKCECKYEMKMPICESGLGCNKKEMCR